jgi:hypothetical protein
MRQHSATAMFSTLKSIKSKYRSVLTDEHLTELVRTTALTTYQPNFKKPIAYSKLCYSKYFVLKTRMLLKLYCASRVVVIPAV